MRAAALSWDVPCIGSASSRRGGSRCGHSCSMRSGRPISSRSCSALTFLQIDPTAAIAPSADLVAWSRLGSAYQPDQLKQALEQDRTLFEHNALVRPMSDVGLYLAGAAAWPPYERTRAWLGENDRFRRDILEVIGRSGPLTSRDIPDTATVPWASTGWTNNRNVTQMLECLMMRGEVAIAGRVGRERLWDLPELCTRPASSFRRSERQTGSRTSGGSPRSASPGRRPRRCRWSRPTSATPASRRSSRRQGRVARRPDRPRRRLRGPHRPAVAVRPADPRPRPHRGAFRLRVHARDVQAAREATLGVFALPVLHDDRLVGKVDAAADREASVLRVNAIHEDVARPNSPGQWRGPPCGGRAARLVGRGGRHRGALAAARHDRMVSGQALCPPPPPPFLFTDVEGSTRLLQEHGAGIRRRSPRGAPARAAGGVRAARRRRGGHAGRRLLRRVPARGRCGRRRRRAQRALEAGPIRVRMGSTPASRS